MKALVLIFALLLPLVSVVAVNAQTLSSGSVSGTIADAGGALIAGATVELIDPTSNRAQNTVSNRQGGYVITNVAPGTYRLIVSSAGFKRAELSVQVEVAKSVLVNVNLVVGSVQQ
jgi:hypothetical protein